MKTLFVLLDGAEDHPVPQFGGRKPLEVAETPFIDSLLSDCGSTQGSTYTHRFINQLFTGSLPRTPRGAIEALGLNLRMDEGRVAYRLSPARVSEGWIEWDYHVDDALEKDIIKKFYSHIDMLNPYDPDVLFFLKGRAVITLNSNEVISLPCPPMPAPMKYRPDFMWPLIEELSEELDGLTLMPWGGGKTNREATLHKGVAPLTVVSNSPTALGISRALGQGAVKVDALEERFPIARDLLEETNVFLHADEIDEVSHQRDPELKVKLLEQLDSLLEDHFHDYKRIALLVDHGTSSVTGEHLPMEVPVACNYDAGLNKRKIALSELMPYLLSHSRE